TASRVLKPNQEISLAVMISTTAGAKLAFSRFLLAAVTSRLSRSSRLICDSSSTEAGVVTSWARATGRPAIDTATATVRLLSALDEVSILRRFRIDMTQHLHIKVHTAAYAPHMYSGRQPVYRCSAHTPPCTDLYA